MTAPDLRTAALAVSTAWDATWGKVGVAELENTMAPLIDALRVASLAAEATEPPADPGGFVAEILADYGDDLTNADDRVEAINRIASALTPGSAPNPQGADEAERIHLRDHLTDGRWHDRCKFCQRRRVEGGTGVPDEPGDDDLAAQLRRQMAANAESWDQTLGAVRDELTRLRTENGALRIAYRLAETALAQWEAAYPGSAEVERLRAAAPASEDDERKPWTFDVEYVGGPQPVDYGTGTEWDGSWQWAIFNGPSQETDVVLLGFAEDEDPTPVLAALVAEHNWAGSPPPTPAPEQETTDGR